MCTLCPSDISSYSKYQYVPFYLTPNYDFIDFLNVYVDIYWQTLK